MKLLKYILIVFVVVSINACDESILNEVPLDFYSPENAYVTPEDMEAAMFTMYSRLREHYDGNNFSVRADNLHAGTDLCMSGRSPETSHLGNYPIELTPTSSHASDTWTRMYRIIYDANVILNRLESTDYIDENLKEEHKGEAMFFRGYAYRHLAHLYGGVPIVLEEISEPKRDFTRAPKQDVVLQAISDLKYAAEALPGVEDVKSPGRVNSAAAWHALAELYITAGDYDKSIEAANKVINNPDIEIMTTRFGRKANEEGDPYWDLFQRFNLNRGNGNKEAIMVLQSEYNMPGGYSDPGKSGFGFEYQRSYNPLYWFIPDPDGINITFGFTSHQGGRCYGYIRPTPYFEYDIWGNGNWDVDLRNHSRNIKRHWEVNNPASAWIGKTTADFPSPWYENLSDVTLLRDFYPMVTKATTMNDYPAEDIKNPETGELHNVRFLRNDWYLMRVAETYLLRAEAKLHKGDVAGATADINIIRARSNAIPATTSEVDLDYLLDERMRELSYEENRRNTLARLGLVYERTKGRNPYGGATIQPHNNLYPIPYPEIERNTLEVLEQNPGYTN